MYETDFVNEITSGTLLGNMIYIYIYIYIYVCVCLSLKIWEIKKAIWNKRFKNSRKNFKIPKRLNSSPETSRKK
jgi:hypothetical protein